MKKSFSKRLIILQRLIAGGRKMEAPIKFPSPLGYVFV
jgi:hypothetical protein